jgi:hypothetical protein
VVEGVEEPEFVEEVVVFGAVIGFVGLVGVAAAGVIGGLLNQCRGLSVSDV